MELVAEAVAAEVAVVDVVVEVVVGCIVEAVVERVEEVAVVHETAVVEEHSMTMYVYKKPARIPSPKAIARKVHKHVLRLPYLSS